jgi:hypothetical protein
VKKHEKEMEMTTENAGQRGWMLVKLADETKTEDVAKAIWKANEGDWLKAKGSDIELGCVSRADAVHLDAALAAVLGCQAAIVVPIALKDGASADAASEAIKGFAGEDAEVFWLRVMAHNPAIIVADEGAEEPAMRFPIPSPLDKGKPAGATAPLDVIEGHSAWG